MEPYYVFFIATLSYFLATTKCEDELSVLIKHGHSFACIARGEHSSAPLAWVPHSLDAKVNMTEESFWLPNPPPEYNNLKCNLKSSAVNCSMMLQNYNREGWEISSKLAQDFGILEDHRWNNLMTVRTTGNPSERIQMKVQNSGKSTEETTQFLSLLAKNNLEVLLAESVNSSTTRAFKIVIDGWVNYNDLTRSQLYWCQNGAQSCKQIDSKFLRRTILHNGTSWLILGISFKLLLNNGGTYINFKNNDSVNLNKDGWRDTNTLTKVNYIFLSSRYAPAYIKFQTYNVLQHKSNTSILKASFKTSQEILLCISVIYLTRNDGGTLTLMSERNDKDAVVTLYFSKTLVHGTYDNVQWRELRHNFSLEKNNNYEISMKPPASGKLLIGDIRVCNSNEAFVARMDGSDEGTCTNLKSNQKLNTVSVKKERNKFLYACLNGTFGSDCSLRCSDVFPGNSGCLGISECSDQFCSCLPGYYGDKCEKNCSDGYGPQCTKCSENCKNRCHLVAGHCECQDGWIGEMCNQKCSTGTYGERCSQNCSGHCKDNSMACNHVDGSCPSGCEYGWRSDQCHKERARLSYALKKGKLYSDKIEVQLPFIRGDNTEIKSIDLKYRVAGTKNWKDGPVFKSYDKLILSDLTPDTKYELRAVFKELDGGSYDRDDIPIATISTNCKEAVRSQIVASSTSPNTIKVQVNLKTGVGVCKYHTYSVAKDDETEHSLNNDFTYEITGLDPATEYKIYVKTVTLTHHEYAVCTFDEKGNPTTPSDPNISIISAVLAVLITVLVVTLGAFWWRRKKNQKALDQEILHVNRELASKGGITVPVGVFSPEAPPRPASRSQKSVSFSKRVSTNGQGALPLPSKPIRTNREPQDFPPAPSHSHLVTVAEFQDYVQNSIDSGLLKTQHALFPRGQTASWVEGRRPEHKGKNRYGNLVAYDETRVRLDPLPGQPHSHYINANYIDGYKGRGAYIATQGPKENTLGDFWRMIWQENVSTIVMLANIIENGKVKCEQYWPDKDSEEKVMGGVSVLTVSEQILLYYTIREMRITKDNITRKIVHLHYTTWPDHGVPRYIHTVSAFIRHVISVLKPSTPLVVHCSAGVGRTGTVILAHASLQMAGMEDSVDLLALLSTIRSQRPNMVDNHDQYQMAHEVLVDLLCTEDTLVPCNKFSAKIKSLMVNNGFYEEFCNIDEACQSDITESGETLNWPSDKNRFIDIVPGSSGRVMISSARGDYINAVYVDGVVNRGRYIVTQLPLPNTLEDLWLMMWQRASILLLLNQPDPSQDNSTCEIFPADQSELWVSATMRISVMNVSERKIFQIRTIEIKNNETVKGVTKTGRREVMVISMRGWSAGTDVPSVRPQDVVQLWDEVDRQRKDAYPVVVACYDGASACGIYVTAGHILEGLRLTGNVDVGVAMRSVRHNRSQLVTSHEQYKFLHDVVQAYFDMYDTYANFH